MRNLFILFGFIMMFSMKTFAQNYSRGEHYQYRGGSSIVCSNCHYSYRHKAYIKNCRKNVWYQEQYSGYVSIWNGYRYMNQWKTGYYWSFRYRYYTRYCY